MTGAFLVTATRPGELQVGIRGTVQFVSRERAEFTFYLVKTGPHLSNPSSGALQVALSDVPITLPPIPIAEATFVLEARRSGSLTITPNLQAIRQALAAEEAGTAGAADAGTAGAETAGAETAGAETAGAETAGAETAGAETAGAGTASAETAGAATAGAESAGAATAGADAAAGAGAAAAGTLVAVAIAALATYASSRATQLGRDVRALEQDLDTLADRAFHAFGAGLAGGSPPHDSNPDVQHFYQLAIDTMANAGPAPGEPAEPEVRQAAVELWPAQRQAFHQEFARSVLPRVRVNYWRAWGEAHRGHIQDLRAGYRAIFGQPPPDAEIALFGG